MCIVFYKIKMDQQPVLKSGILGGNKLDINFIYKVLLKFNILFSKMLAINKKKL